MPRRRKTTEEHKRTGADKKNPQRFADRENEPTDLKPLGPPSASLNKQQKDAWKEIVSNSHPGTLCSADRLLMEMASRMLVAIRTETKVNAAMYMRFQMFLSEMGMTPAARSKVSVAPVKEENEDFGAIP